MPRRKRSSVDSSLEDEITPAKRSRKRGTEGEVNALCHEIFDSIKSHKSDNGLPTFNLFMKLPHKRSEPEYFKAIANPIDLLRILTKIKNDEYASIDQMGEDLRLLVENAMDYYEEDSEERDLANQLWIYYRELKNEKCGDVASDSDKNQDWDNDSTESEDVGEICEEMFDAVATAMEGDRMITEMFKLLPSKTKFPDYYNVIEEPLDLRTVAKRVQGRHYETLDNMVRDLMVIVNNARTYNQPGSGIYKDAVLLKKTIQAKKIELDTVRQAKKSSHRMRSAERRVHTGERHSTAYASLPSPNGDSDNESDTEENSCIAGTGALWSLYNTVMNYRSPDGRRLSEPFMRLPSKRLYPDYYEEIDNPISLFHIKKKIKNNMYGGDVAGLVSDLDLLFLNAQHYNVEDSQLFKDSVSLQKVMHNKSSELQALCDPNDDSQNASASRRSRRDSLQKKLGVLFKTVSDYEVDGRSLIDIFVTLPSKESFPDYYQVITEPIDMDTIEARLEQYDSIESLAEDIELMLRNARHYNEENSQVYKDAVVLERVLKTKLQSLTSPDSPRSRTPVSSNRVSRRDSKVTSKWNTKLQSLYACIKDATDKNNRVLSVPFMRLPSKNEYPDYYDVIKKPIDLLKIGHKLNLYESLDDLLADLALMFDNACKYNEPDSLIYKDALALLKLALDKKSELEKNEEERNQVPDVKVTVFNILKELTRSTLSQTDSQGRCLSESLAHLPLDEDEMIIIPNAKKASCSLDKIGKRVEKEMYTRLDKLQEDVFELLEHGRSVAAIDSELYEDCCNLQKYFVQRRDELCGLGGVFFSPALAYTQRRITDEIDKEKAEKIKAKRHKRNQEKHDDKENLSEATYNDISYARGDFAYIIPEEGKEDNQEMLLIDKIYREERLVWLEGVKFLKPHQTYHVISKKFFEQEVFKSDVRCAVEVERARGKCIVLPMKTYIKMYCEQFPEEHTWVCDKRYLSKPKTFKRLDPKLKIWSGSSSPKLSQRPNPMQPAKVGSVYAEKGGGTPTQSTDEDEDDDFDGDSGRTNVPIESGTAPPGVTMYEQLRDDRCGWLKLGDFVYVRDGPDNPWRIIRAEQLWTDAESVAHVSGAQFVQPAFVEHSPTRLFYAMEVVRNADASVPISKVTGKCCVLFFKEYCSQRSTVISEDDVWICESKFIPDERIVKKLTKPMKKITLSSRVLEDEILFLKKPLIPKRTGSPLLSQSLLDLEVDDSYAIPPSISSLSMNNSTPNNVDVTPKMKQKASQLVHDLFNSNSKDRFTLIDDLIGDIALLSKKDEEETSKELTGKKTISEKIETFRRQANLEKYIKESFDKFKKNDERMKTKNLTKKRMSLFKEIVEDRINEENISSPMYKRPKQLSGYIVFAGEYRKGIQGQNPLMNFGDISRLVGAKWRELPKDEKERYEEKAKKIAGEQSALYSSSIESKPSTPAPSTISSAVASLINCDSNSQTGGAVACNNSFQSSLPITASTTTPAQQTRSSSPLFVAVPPRTQRLLHSEAYLRYIEGLNNNSDTIGPWRKELSARPTNTLGNPQKLPTNWLGPGAIEQGKTVVQALWALRDQMLQDAVNIGRVLDYSAF